MSNRLVGNAVGLSNNQGGSMGEGWAASSFFSRSFVRGCERPPMPTGTASIPDMAYSVWAPGNKAFYDGLRRYPYSADLTKNPLTFKHIEDGVPLPTTRRPPLVATVEAMPKSTTPAKSGHRCCGNAIRRCCGILV